MIPIKKKKCKGTGKAKGYDCCGNNEFLFRYGLCKDCFRMWLFNTKEGKDVLNKIKIKAKSRVVIQNKMDLRQQKKEILSANDLKKKLQNRINKIVRLIDTDKGCISCEHGWNSNWTRQRHAGHRLSVGSHSNLRFHLFNIFVQCSICNNWKSSNDREYDKGLIKHYGKQTLELAKSLNVKHPNLKLCKTDLEEIIKTANKIIKEINLGKDFSRDEINNLLNIYES